MRTLTIEEFVNLPPGTFAKSVRKTDQKIQEIEAERKARIAKSRNAQRAR